MIYLDNAATSGKKPQTVYDAVSDALINHCSSRKQYLTDMKAGH